MSSTRTRVFCRFRFEALHHWADAPEEVFFLRSVHRHVFHVEAGLWVSHDDRDVEFILLQRRLSKLSRDKVKRDAVGVLTWSCEHWARFFYSELDLDYVEVSEDGENGARIERCEQPAKTKTTKAGAGEVSCRGCAEAIREEEEMLRSGAHVWHRACLEEVVRPSGRHPKVERAEPAEPEPPPGWQAPGAPEHKVVEESGRRSDGLAVILYSCVCGLEFGESKQKAFDHEEWQS